MTVKWLSPKYDGGFPIRSYKLYVDNSLQVELDPSVNVYQLTSLTLGQKLKLQVSALNEVGESILSISSTITFANLPTPPETIKLTASLNPT
jgi:hypothetical protein